MAKSAAKTAPIKHISKLANLNLSEEQLKNAEGGLQSVLAQMQEITTLDLHQATETSRVIEEENILREDVVEESFTQEQALTNAKSNYQGYFMVNNILEQRDA